MSAIARRYYVRAVEALRRGELDGARDGLRGALELAPGFIAARIAFASLLARNGEAARARASCCATASDAHAPAAAARGASRCTGRSATC